MSYEEIFILGWKFNGFMLVLNMLIVFRALKSRGPIDLRQENEMLEELKDEFSQYYPYRKYGTLLSYFIPFMASFKIFYRLIEMYSFTSKNIDASIFDYMEYKYRLDIQKAKDNQ